MRLVIWMTAATVLLAACATPPKQQSGPKIYTDMERKRLTYCIGIVDSATYIASQKTEGVPRQSVIDHYTGKPYEKLNVALVAKVYSDQFTSVWDYSMDVFGECAQNIAQVSEERVRHASYCMQGQLVVAVAHAYKTQGAPKEKAYTHFQDLNKEYTKAITDKVYASAKNRGQIKLDVWNDCIRKYSE